ncbi:hypothetical protein QM996_02520 [Sinorhizobium chiapasense]
MQILYEIAEGHKRGENGLNEYIKSNPGIAREIAIQQWVQMRFGSWITDNISKDYYFVSTSDKQFVIDFTYGDDGNLFIKKLGGHELEA